MAAPKNGWASPIPQVQAAKDIRSRRPVRVEVCDQAGGRGGYQLARQKAAGGGLLFAH